MAKPTETPRQRREAEGRSFAPKPTPSEVERLEGGRAETGKAENERLQRRSGGGGKAENERPKGGRSERRSGGRTPAKAGGRSDQAENKRTPAKAVGWAERQANKYFSERKRRVLYITIIILQG